MKLIAALASMLEGLFGQILISLGLSVVTYKGLETIVANFKERITAAVTGVPDSLLQIFYIAGGGTALNIILGAFTFYISLQGISKLTSIFGKK